MSNVGKSFSVSATGRSGWSTGAIPFDGMFTAGIGYDAPTSGGGIKGWSATPLPNHTNNAGFGRSRFVLRDAWNGSVYNNKNKRIQTPFRATMNAGDTLLRQNYACGGGGSGTQSRPSVHGISSHLGGGNTTCMPSVLYSLSQIDVSVPAANCNGKFVYDGSDYVSYLKRRSINKNYNDRAYGGNEHSGAQSRLKAVRH